jgi:predicted amidohydrolase YtcJ
MTKTRAVPILSLILIVSLASVCNKVEDMADLVLVDGIIWTGESAQPWAEALAVKGSLIQKVGSSREIRKYTGKRTEVIELRGGLVLPGFIDSHTHFLDGGFSLLSLELRDAASREEFIGRIEATGTINSSGPWNCRSANGSIR